jgi:hypothetical protein
MADVAEGTVGSEGLTPQERSSADIIGDNQRENSHLGSLFGESISDADLHGGDDNSNSDKSEIATPSEKDSQEDKAGAEGGEKGKGEADAKEGADKTVPPAKADNDKPEGIRPPDGYVPLKALHEERAARKQLSAELNTMREELDALKSASKQDVPEAPAEEKFKVLSDEEFETLAEEDIFAAVKYQRDLAKHLDEKTKEDFKEKETKKEAELRARKEYEIVTKSAQKIQDLVPGIYDDESDVNSNLTAFAITNGFNPEDIATLTHPGTKLIPPGATEPIMLGDGAAAIIGVLHKFYTSEKDLRERLEKEITEKVQADIMGKLKGEQEFKSLGDTPGSPEKVNSGKMSESQLSRMSLSDQRKYLGG